MASDFAIEYRRGVDREPLAGSETFAATPPQCFGVFFARRRVMAKLNLRGIICLSENGVVESIESRRDPFIDTF